MRTKRWLSTLLLIFTAGCYTYDFPQQDPNEPAPMDNDAIPEPRIDSFTVSADLVDPNTTIDLAYSVADAETVSIATDRGVTVLPPTTQLVGTAFTRPITEDSSFILTASNKEKSTSKLVMVRIKQAEALTHASIQNFDGPTSIATGGSGTLLWRTTDAASGVIKGGEEVLLTIATTDLVAGQFMIGPSADTVYTIAVKGTDGQEITMTRLVQVTTGGGPEITARELFDRNIASILQAKCGACHMGGAPDVNGPNWLGASSSVFYSSITTDVTFSPRFFTQVPEDSLFLLKGEHAGPALCNSTNTNSAGLNRNCTPTSEEQSVIAWLLKESQERFGTMPPPPVTPPPTDFTPRTASEALTRFGACMDRADWDATYGQSNQTQAARQNTVQGPCFSCHSAGTGGSFLSSNSGDTFDYNRQRPYVLKLVQNSGPNMDGSFNPVMLPAYRWRDKAAGDGTHPNYVLSDARNNAINDFVLRTMTRYNDFTQNCGAPAQVPPAAADGS